MPKKKTDEEFKKEIIKLVGNEYVFLDSYVNSKTKLNVKHTICNNKYKVSPTKFLMGQRCPYCVKNSPRKLSNDEFIKRFYNKFSNKEYEVIDCYLNSNKPIKILHKSCNHYFYARPYNLLKKNNTKCPYCYGNILKTDEEFRKEVFNLVNNEYTFLESYINSDSPIKILHNKCNKIYKVRPYDFLSGKRCPYCKKSKGEEKIKKYLDLKNIFYEQQYSFDDCRNINPLKFDFKLEDDSGKIILIEYDGIQHFQESFYNDNLEKQKLRDKIKDDYCRSHSNIDLYRISYKDFNNIETILDMIISKYE